MVLKRPVIIGYGLSWNLVKRMTFLDPGPRGLDENQGSRTFFLGDQRRACVHTRLASGRRASTRLPYCIPTTADRLSATN